VKLHDHDQRQQNMPDCGIFALLSAESWLNENAWPRSQATTTATRCRIEWIRTFASNLARTPAKPKLIVVLPIKVNEPQE
jgi:Ulp1 family protease